jgi:hypothetical protein
VVISALANQIDTGDDVLQLKLVQALLALLTVCAPHNGPLMQALDVCFRLASSKSISVQATAQASLRQIVLQLFDRIATDPPAALHPAAAAAAAPAPASGTPGSGPRRSTLPDGLGPAATDAYSLFQDICLLANGDQARFLQTEALTAELSLELIQTVLENHVDVFRKVCVRPRCCSPLALTPALPQPAFTTLLRERVCCVLMKALSGGTRNAFPVAVRLLSAVATTMKLYSDLLVTEGEVFLSVLVKTLDAEGPLWLKVATMEVMRQFCSEPRLLKCGVAARCRRAGLV